MKLNIQSYHHFQIEMIGQGEYHLFFYRETRGNKFQCSFSIETKKSNIKVTTCARNIKIKILNTHMAISQFQKSYLIFEPFQIENLLKQYIVN